MLEVAIMLDNDEIFKKNTIFGGNIDIDKLRPRLKQAQIHYVKYLFCDNLYDKLYNDFINKNLSGTYLYIYENFFAYLLMYKAAELYATNGAYTIDNKGISKIQADNAVSIDYSEISLLKQDCYILYDNVREEWFRWLRNNIMTIEEQYRPTCIECNYRMKKIGTFIV